MRKSASEIIRELETRIARLEKQNKISFKTSIRGLRGSWIYDPIHEKGTKASWSSVNDLLSEVQRMYNSGEDNSFFFEPTHEGGLVGFTSDMDDYDQPLERTAIIKASMNDLLLALGLEDQGRFSKNKRALLPTLKSKLTP